MPKAISFPPSFDERAELLILGSMPGAESLREQQYYAFKFNAFWRIMGELFDFSPALPYPERLAILRDHHVALWDTLGACERTGSLDTAIRNAKPNDIPGLLAQAPNLRKVCCNGGASYRYFKRFFPNFPLPVEQLISTSPAAARYSYPEKLVCWRRALTLNESSRSLP